jgi:hypothetical protein
MRASFTTAMLVANDQMALGAMRAITVRLRVGADAGRNAIDRVPPLTSIKQDTPIPNSCVKSLNHPETISSAWTAAETLSGPKSKAPLSLVKRKTAHRPIRKPVSADFNAADDKFLMSEASNVESLIRHPRLYTLCVRLVCYAKITIHAGYNYDNDYGFTGRRITTS